MTMPFIGKTTECKKKYFIYGKVYVCVDLSTTQPTADGSVSLLLNLVSAMQSALDLKKCTDKL